MIRRTWARAVSLFRRRALDQDFDDEAQSHLDLATDDYLRRGLPLSEARQMARLKFGSIAASKDAHRDSRRVAWLDALIIGLSVDFIRHALRLWMREAARRAVLTVFLILSLAISLAGGVFALSLNSAVLWRGLPFENADDLVSIQATTEDGQPRWLSWPELDSVAASPVAPFESVAGFTAADFNALSEPALPPEPLTATVVSAGFFETFRVRLALGVLPEAAAYGATRDRVVLLTHDFWQRRYRGAAAIVGRTIRLSRPEYLGGGDDGYRVVGVLARDTWLLWEGVDIVLPMQADSSRIGDPSSGLFERTVGRTSRGASLSSARSSAPVLLNRVRMAGSSRPAASLSMSALQDSIFADLRPQLTVVLWLAIVVLSLAGINVVLFTIARATEERRGMAIRLAVGASRARLLGETVYQQGITVCLAAAAGLVLALWLVSSVGTQMPEGWLARIPGRLSALRVDADVLGWLVAALAGTIVLSCGAVHAITRRLRPWALLSSAGAEDDRRSSLWRSTLVGVEIAICSAVVTMALALTAQLTTLRSVTYGVEQARTSAVWINLGSAGMSGPAARVSYYDRILREAELVPEVESIGGISHPFNIGWQSVQVRDGSSTTSPDVTALDRTATPGYLTASGIVLLDGRWFDERDRAGAPDVAVVSSSLAKARWPDRPALGQQVKASGANGAWSSLTVVGVVADTRHLPHLPPDRTLYRAVAQAPPPWLYLVMRARPGSDPIKAVSDAVWRVNPDQPIDGPWPFAETIERRTAHLRFLTLISIVLGGVGALLAATGLYGLMSWSVVSSMRSIAVRRAVGASDRQILSWYGSRWARIVLPGLIGGGVLQMWWTSALVAAIQGLQAPTPIVVTTGTALMVVAAAGAAAAPLRRALTTDNAALMQ